jgi:FHA domain-containing protein
VAEQAALPTAQVVEFAPEMGLPSPPSAAPDMALQAFGLKLSGDAPATGVAAPLPPPEPPFARADHNAPPPGSLEALSAAFLEGAGLTPDRAKLELTPEFMRAFGEAFRVAIEGSIDLLAARSEIKQEFRAGVTIIGSSANNPLKFLPNADGVIMQMVGQHFPGFMKPVPAIKEAFGDLRVHQLALMAGIRAAYSEALTRFDPLKMEELTPRAGLFGSLYDGARKAALWDEYKKNFSQLKNAAEDDMTAFSGQTFVQAYEQAASAAKQQA